MQYNTCQSEGMSLQLHNLQENAIDFTVWKSVGIISTIYNLSIQFDETIPIIANLQAKAFEYFSQLTSLNVENFHMESLVAQVFLGLKQLTHLSVKNCIIHFIEREFLMPIHETLKYLHLHVLDSETLDINRILPASMTFPKLETLKIHGNLANSLENKTFSGLINIHQLDLSNCNIATLPNGIFSTVQNTLLELNLNHNQLTTIDTDQFKGIAANRILLQYNPWHCDCNIIDLIDTFSDQEFTCETPSCLVGLSGFVFNDRYCQDTEELFDVCATLETASNLKLDRKTITMECVDDATSNCEEIKVQNESVMKNLRTETNGDVIVEVNDYAAASYMVIWFETISSVDGSNQVYYESSSKIECISPESSVQFRIPNLVQQRTYTICLVDKMETTVSPFDCLPYYAKSNDMDDEAADKTAWLMHEDRPIVIGVVSGSAVLSGLFGLVVAIVLIRRNPIWLSGSRRVVGVSGTKDVMVMPTEWRKKSIAEGRT